MSSSGTNIGFNHGVLGLAENPARGTGFWSQNTEGITRGVLTEKARPESKNIEGPHHIVKGNQHLVKHVKNTLSA